MLEEKGVELPEAFKEIDRIVNTPNTLLVGHNILTFDNKFLNYYLQLYLYKEITNSICFDTAGQLKAELVGFNLEDFDSVDKMHSKALSKTVKGLHYKLSDALSHYKIRYEDRLHGAISDVEATYKIYLEQVKRGLPKGNYLEKERETDLFYKELINDEKKKRKILEMKLKRIENLKKEGYTNSEIKIKLLNEL
jgi:DNA polymerase III epsilon subunit-like protein